MNKTILLAALLAASAFGASAQSTNTNEAGSTSNAVSSPSINSGNSSAGSDSSSVSNPNNQANQQVQLNTYTPEKQTIEQSVHYSGTQTVKNVPSVALSGPASGPCQGSSGSVGIAGPGFGIGGNYAAVMADCQLRENTRVLGMSMQALDGAAYPNEKAEVTALFMESVRGLAAMNRQTLNKEVPQAQRAAATTPATVVAESSCVGYSGSDPVVRARLGCK